MKASTKCDKKDLKQFYRLFLKIAFNRPFPSSPQSTFQSEIFVMVISYNINMNENDIHNKDFTRRVGLK